MKDAATKRKLNTRRWRDHFMAGLTKRFSGALLAILAIATLTLSVKSQIAAGTGVSVATQRSLGLVTVNGGCSGTLLNQFWVLTARHCVTVGNKIGAPLQPAANVSISAKWTGQVGTGVKIQELGTNSATAKGLDIVLVYLGNTNLGETGNQKLFTVYRDGKISGRLKTTDSITQYGIGFSTFAKDLVKLSEGLGTYRSSVLTPSDVTDTHYNLVMNGSNQSGHGGDSGGPSIVTIYGQSNGGIAGVQSTCHATAYVPGAPIPMGASNPDWLYAMGIDTCGYVPTEPFIDEIAKFIKEAPRKAPYIDSAVVATGLRQYQPLTSVILAWDAGPAYPNIQVYVSVNKGPEIPAFSVEFPQGSLLWKAPKSSGEHKLPRSSGFYRYLLKSGGITLAFTEFYVP